MARGAAQVEKAALSEDDDAVAVGEDEPVHLRLDVDLLDAGGGVEAGHVDLVVEVADVPHDGVVLHLQGRASRRMSDESLSHAPDPHCLLLDPEPGPPRARRLTRAMWLAMMMSLLPVVVTTMSAVDSTSSSVRTS